MTKPLKYSNDRSCDNLILIFIHTYLDLKSLSKQDELSKNYLINKYEITSGIATSSLIHPREIFRAAIRLGCTAIVVVHNHPSGDPCPSKADIEVAKTLVKSSKIICIELLDFMIIGKKSIDPLQKGYNSFRENNLL